MVLSPKRYIYDTDVFIDFLRGDAASSRYLNRQRELPCSIITACELIQGAHNTQAKRAAEKLINRLTVIPLAPPSCDITYRLITHFAHSHGLRIPDALIAATAIEKDAVLVTGNLKHYSFIKELAVVNWRSLKTE